MGPATASVILSWVRPDVFCYMYDEVLDCFLPKRTYTIKAYLTCRTKCHEHAERLQWTPEKAARTLWTAAKAKALGVVGVGGAAVVGGLLVDETNKGRVVDGVKDSKRQAHESASSGDMGSMTKRVRRNVR